ncbi:hypothetical protein JCGZ_23731 [Jatropha curcas]|uniref:Uncharacterized protein n=1 Tax=Jatropha curcas TaxID=180498 RepID=A0A067JPI8_JATCU|nr:hypothetical protein JCGZ_23731 [Jatropha curcas]
MRGFATTDHLAAFVPGAYASFVRTQLFVYVHQLIEFDPFSEVEELDRDQGDAPAQRQQRDKRVWRGFNSKALDKAVVVNKPEHELGASFSFILKRTGEPTQTMLETHLVSPYWMSPVGCTHNKVCQLYKAACLKLVVVRLSNEHVSLAWRLQLVGAEEFNVAGVLVKELFTSRLSLKRQRTLAVMTWRR